MYGSSLVAISLGQVDIELFLTWQAHCYIQKRQYTRINGLRSIKDTVKHVVDVFPLQPSSSVNPGCPGPESSFPVSSRLACPISSHVTDHWGEPCNRTGDVHPVDPFHSLEYLKNHFASIAFCRNSVVCQ